MKKLFLLFLLTVSFHVSADPITGKIDDIVCGEMDPFIIGDACILFTTDSKTNNKMGLVYHDYDWAMVFGGDNWDTDQFIGRKFEADLCETFKSHEAIRELKDYNSDYFYLSCNLSGFNFTK